MCKAGQNFYYRGGFYDTGTPRPFLWRFSPKLFSENSLCWIKFNEIVRGFEYDAIRSLSVLESMISKRLAGTCVWPCQAAITVRDTGICRKSISCAQVLQGTSLCGHVLADGSLRVCSRKRRRQLRQGLLTK